MFFGNLLNAETDLNCSMRAVPTRDGVEGDCEDLPEPEYCDHAEYGCPLTAFAPELARADEAMKAQIFEELTKYKSRMLPFMPGQRTADKERAFFSIFSTMVGFN
jgi:hypothetical protein